MMNNRWYAAVNEGDGRPYSPENLMNAIGSIANPFDFRKYGVKPIELPNVHFFETIGGRNVLAVQVVEGPCPHLQVIITSEDNHPRIIKARLEARAKGLKLAEGA